MDEARRFEHYRSLPTSEALLELLRESQETVYNLCYQVLRHRQNAEDAAQKVFLRLLDDLPRITDGEHYRRWIHKVAFHTALDLKRRQDTVKHYAAQQSRRTDTRTQQADVDLHEHLALLDGDLRALIVDHYFNAFFRVAQRPTRN